MELQNKCKTNSILEWRFKEKGREVKFGAYVHASQTITLIKIMNTLIGPEVSSDPFAIPSSCFSPFCLLGQQLFCFL